VNDSGFLDDAPNGTSFPVGTPAGRRARHRPSPAGAGFAVLVLALFIFGGWAWSARAHADDVAAYEALAEQVEEMDRSLTQLGHSEIPPCRKATEGRITRSYPATTGPQAGEVVGYLEPLGWTREIAVPPTVARLSRQVNGHDLTIDIMGGSLSQLPESLVAQSSASRIGCLGR